MHIVQELYHGKSAKTTEYCYYTGNNELLGSVKRCESKRDIGNGWYLDAQQRVANQIYNLPELCTSEQPILIVDDEYICNIASKTFKQLCAISFLFGVNSISMGDLYYLKNKRVYVVSELELETYAIELLESCSKNLTHMCASNAKWETLEGKKEISALIQDKIKSSKKFIIDSYPELKATKNYLIVKNMSDNLNHLLEHHHIDVKYNEMTRDDEITIPGLDISTDCKHKLQNSYIKDLCEKHEMPISRVEEHISYLATHNSYHPIRQWIESKELDSITGRTQYKEFLSCLKTTNDKLTHILLTRWMIAAVKMLYEPICAQGVLVLQGEQSTHKTSFFQSLVPTSHNAVLTGHYLSPSVKDTVLIALKHWIVELGELDATFRKSDIAQLKAFITSGSDEIRRPYDRKSETLERRTIFAGTVNDSKFLVDETGNRRWWTVQLIDSIDINRMTKLELQQVWRYVYELYKRGETHYLSKSELALLNQHNVEFEHIDPVIDGLHAHFDLDAEPKQYLSPTQVLNLMGYQRPTKSETTRLACYLTKQGIKKGGGKNRRNYFMPALL